MSALNVNISKGAQHSKVLVIVLLFLLIVASVWWVRFGWRGSRVEARLERIEITGFKTVFVIRSYPTSTNPFESDGRFYGCEVYFDHILAAAAAYRFDSFEAKSFRIESSSPNAAHFYIDDYDVGCTNIGWNGATWTAPY